MTRLITGENKTSGYQSRQCEVEIWRLQEEERRSLSKIQRDLYEMRQCLSRNINKQTGDTTSKKAVKKKVLDNLFIRPACPNGIFGLKYHKNGDIKDSASRKLKALSSAHSELLKQLKESQKAFRRPTSSLSSSQVNAAIPTRPNTEDAANRSHACRGITATNIYKTDCRLCTKLMNKRINSLVKSQAAAIGSNELLSQIGHINKTPPYQVKTKSRTNEDSQIDIKLYEKNLRTLSSVELSNTNLLPWESLLAGKYNQASSSKSYSYRPSPGSRPMIRRKSTGSIERKTKSQSESTVRRNRTNVSLSPQQHSSTMRAKSKVSFSISSYPNQTRTSANATNNAPQVDDFTPKLPQYRREPVTHREPHSLSERRMRQQEVKRQIKEATKKEEIKVTEKVQQFLKNLGTFVQNDREKSTTVSGHLPMQVKWATAVQ